jgi:MEMO1 family protein
LNFEYIRKSLRILPIFKKKKIFNMKKILIWLIPTFFIAVALNCKTNNSAKKVLNIRGLADTVGFAHLGWQMDSVIARINYLFSDSLVKAAQPAGTIWKTAICPHDDYTYVGWLYSAVLKNIKAKTVIIFGVAHKAKTFNLADRLIFDSFDLWQGPYGPVKVSPFRKKLIEQIPAEMFEVNDSMQTVEHSVEALIPFLQQQNPQIEIVSIIVPYMDLKRMDSISRQLAKALFSVISENKLIWGEDLALLITSDAVHYGDEEWGGKNYAPYGTDSLGYEKATSNENEIISKCFDGELSQEKAARFFEFTVSHDNYKEYKWTWCGRYCIPFGLKTSEYLHDLLKKEPLKGIPVAYATSISQQHLHVDDIGMGRTAVATLHHWVGYPAIGFK